MRVGMVYDLRDDYLAEGFSEEQVAEFDSPATIAGIEAALIANGHRPERIGHGRALNKRLARGDRWDMVFSIAEGVHGRSREAQVPALLEMYDIPYTFSDPLVCAVTLDKAIAKRLVAAAGVLTPRFAVVSRESDLATIDLKFPVFAKPIAEGTGKGVDGSSRIGDADTLSRTCLRLLDHFDQPILVEEYLPGREFTTAILGTGEQARVLGSMEVRIRADAPGADYSYEIKELCDQYVDYSPLGDEPLRPAVEALALQAYRTLECRDTGRVDIRLDADGQPAFIEINPLPGLHPHHSDFPIIATQQGMSYNTLIGHILASAMERLP